MSDDFMYIKKVEIKSTEFGGKQYFYVDFGSEVHGEISFRLWISEKLVKHNEKGEFYIEFPIKATIIKTEKENFVMKPSEDSVVHNVILHGSAREHTHFEIVDPTPVLVLAQPYRNDPENEVTTAPVKILYYAEYWSPQGRLGIDEGALIETHAPDKPIKFKYWLNYVSDYGVGLIYPDGKVETFPVDNEDLDEVLQ